MSEPITDNTKFSEFMRRFSSNLNKQGALKVVDWYHNKYVKPGSFSVIIHAMIGISLFSYVVRHQRIEDHKTAPHH